MVRFLWTKGSVVARLQELRSEGEDISPKRLFSRYGGLYNAGRRLFGGSSPMYRAAGISLDVFKRTPPSYWTKERIVAELRAIHSAGEEMSYSSMIRNHSPLYAASTSKFGRYSKALEAAEISYAGFRLFHAPWTKREIVQRIRDLFSKKVDLSASNMKVTESSLYVGATRKYGSWFDALEAAGVAPDMYRKLPRRERRTNLESWTDAKVLNEIRKLAESKEDLAHSAVMKKHPRLESAARIRFHNSWYEALKAAGINPSKIRVQRKAGYWTKAKVIDELQLLAAQGYNLNSANVRRERPDLLTPAEKLFKGYYSALVAAGVPVQEFRKLRPSGYWTRDRVLNELKELHNAGEDISYSAMEEKYLALVKGASKVFGNYENAVKSAGIDYEEVRKDKMQESFIGRVFEKYLEEAMDVLGWKVRPQQRFKIGREMVRPDFVDSETGMWIDAKVDSWSPGVAATIFKYSEFCDRILVIYLKGKKRKWASSDVEIRPVSEYFSALAMNDREDLVRDFEKLKKGIVRPELQSELEKFSKRFH